MVAQSRLPDHGMSPDSLEYPLFAVSVKAAMTMSELKPHQHLMQDGMLTEWSPGMVVIFVSHQWVARRHPDPLMKQFHVLQRFLRNTFDGKFKLETNWKTTGAFNKDEEMPSRELKSLEDAYLWYDYFSCPQMTASYNPQAMKSVDALPAYLQKSSAGEQLLKAVNSIPAYVALCQYFFVLCPQIQHEGGNFCNFLSWSKRGWCKAEEVSRRLSHFNKMVVVVESEKQSFLHDSSDYLCHAVGTGEFSCCHMHHMVDGNPIPCDKIKVSAVVQKLLNDRISQLASSSLPLNIFFHRFLASVNPSLLRGLPNVPTTQEGDLASFLKDLRFSCSSAQDTKPLDDFGSGWGPLFYAALRQDFSVGRQLVEEGESVNQRSKTNICGIFLGPGSTPLMVASFYVAGGDAVRFLLSQRADVDGQNMLKFTALTYAAYAGQVENIKVLLEGGASHNISDALGFEPLSWAAFFARRESVEMLVQAGANVCTDSFFGVCPLHSAAVAGDTTVLRYLLDHDADLEQKLVPRTTKAKVAYRVVTAMALLGVNSPVVQAISQAKKGTALMSAALHGQPLAVQELMLRRADPSAKNNLGNMALDLARMRGHIETEQILLDCLEQLGHDQSSVEARSTKKGTFPCLCRRRPVSPNSEEFN
mmetsp:Transcript_33356/g.109302  ORF Transcript_33356/g.109302 Transcript_33356/m.109302 type:complete len:646 (+) Transcript_33356:75-2012(+)